MKEKKKKLKKKKILNQANFKRNSITPAQKEQLNQRKLGLKKDVNKKKSTKYYNNK